MLGVRMDSACWGLQALLPEEKMNFEPRTICLIQGLNHWWFS